MSAQVIPIDPVARLRLLTRDWRRLGLREITIRFRSISAEQARGVRLPCDVHDAWLQMSAVLTVCGGKT